MLDYPGGPDVIPRVLATKEASDSESEREDIRKETKAKEERRCYAAGFEDGGRGHKLRNSGNL